MVGLIPNSNGEPDHLLEKWSDAARAASAAARQAKARGKNWRKAGRQAYYDRATPRPKGSTYAAQITPATVTRPSGKRRTQRWDAQATAGQWTAAGSGKTPGEAGYAARRDAARQARGWKKVGATGRTIASKFVKAGKMFNRPRSVARKRTKGLKNRTMRFGA